MLLNIIDRYSYLFQVCKKVKYRNFTNRLLREKSFKSLSYIQNQRFGEIICSIAFVK